MTDSIATIRSLAYDGFPASQALLRAYNAYGAATPPPATTRLFVKATNGGSMRFQTDADRAAVMVPVLLADPTVAKIEVTK